VVAWLLMACRSGGRALGPRIARLVAPERRPTIAPAPAAAKPPSTKVSDLEPQLVSCIDNSALAGWPAEGHKRGEEVGGPLRKIRRYAV
jgi:hypothetical protein